MDEEITSHGPGGWGRPFRMSRNSLAAAGLGALVVLMASGCAGAPPGDEGSSGNGSGKPGASGGETASTAAAEVAGPPESTSPTASPSSSPSASPSVLPNGSTAATEDHPAQDVPKPEVPASVWRRDREGAETAVLHFFEAREYMSLTGDSSLFREAAPDCHWCQEEADEYERLYRAGGWGSGYFAEVDILDREDDEEFLNANVTIRLVNDSSLIYYRPDPDDSPEEQQELIEAGRSMTEDGPLVHYDAQQTAFAFFHRDLDRWVVSEDRTWILETPEVLEGFNMRNR